MANIDGEGRIRWTWYVLAFGSVAMVWLAWGLFLPAWTSSSWAELSQRGDAFGILNSLFAGLAFAGVIVAIVLQSQELRLQRRELKLTREEMDRQATALEGQLSAAASQRFDSTFFQLLRLHSDTVEGIRSWTGSNHLEGRAALTRYYGELETVLRPIDICPGRGSKGGDEAEMEKLRMGYDDWYTRSKTELGHYFRNLYHIIKFIDRSEIPNKKTYIGIFRAQLSSTELGLVFYNMIGPGFEKSFPLILRYELLQNLPVVALHKPEHATLIQSYAAEWMEDSLILS